MSFRSCNLDSFQSPTDILTLPFFLLLLVPTGLDLILKKISMKLVSAGTVTSQNLTHIHNNQFSQQHVKESMGSKSGILYVSPPPVSRKCQCLRFFTAMWAMVLVSERSRREQERGAERTLVSTQLRNVGVDSCQRHMRSLCSPECEKANVVRRLGPCQDTDAV